MKEKKQIKLNQDLLPSLKIYLLSTFLIIIYILIVYLFSALLFKDKSAGSLIYDQQRHVRGSLLISQEFTSDKYFHGRVSNRFDSKCDVALYNQIFRDAINSKHSLRPDIQDVSIITASRSLQDPYIMTQEATKQAERVAKARGMDIKEVMSIIEKYRSPPSPPFFELDIVNIMYLNARLDDFII